MSDMYADVGLFHERFGLPRRRDGGGPVDLPADVLEFRLRFMQEELDEFRDARTPADRADALVDLVYVALGTAQMMRLPWGRLWADVQRANMAKERAASADDPRSTRGHVLDVVKPAGWVPPDPDGVLDADDDVARHPLARWHDHYLRIVLAAARASRDPSQRVGAAVAAPDWTLLGVGMNGPPMGADDEGLPLAGPERHDYFFHAEENALYFAGGRAGVPLPVGCWLFSTHRPCARCVRTAAHFGVRRVRWLLDTLDPGQTSDAVRVADALDVSVEEAPWPD